MIKLNEWYEMRSWDLPDNISSQYYLPFKVDNSDFNRAYRNKIWGARIIIFRDNTFDFDMGEFYTNTEALVLAGDITDMSGVFIHNNLTYNVINRVFNYED